MKDSPSVLFVDDDEIATRRLIRSLESKGAPYKALKATTSEQALKLSRDYTPQAAIIDLTINEKIGPDSGFDLIRDLLDIDHTIRIIVLTGSQDSHIGIKAIQHGASSFLNKPVDLNHIYQIILDGINSCHLKRHFLKLQKESNIHPAIPGFITASNAMKDVVEKIKFASSTNQPVLILGETGTGKGVVARAIHSISSRSKYPFVRFQPSFVSSDLVSSELFGHQKGAFTGAIESRKGLIEEADQGTLFIDEIDELPEQTQIQLLTSLQEKIFRRLGQNKEIKSDFRLITATNCLHEKILSGKVIRADFYHRIAHLIIELPPLREREDDIIYLAKHFLKELGDRERLKVIDFSQEALNKLRRYRFPGNVRELMAIVEKAAMLAQFREKRFIEGEDLGFKKGRENELKDLKFRDLINNYEKQLVLEALNKFNNNQSQAAKSLGLDRSTLRRILERED